MTKIFPNEIKQFYAKLSSGDESAKDMLKLKQVALFKDGEIIRKLTAKDDDNVWRTNLSFNKKDKEGDYSVRWSFNFDGEDIGDYIEYITFQKSVKLDINVKDITDIDYDDTLPQDVKDLIIKEEN